MFISHVSTLKRERERERERLTSLLVLFSYPRSQCRKISGIGFASFLQLSVSTAVARGAGNASI